MGKRHFELRYVTFGVRNMIFIHTTVSARQSGIIYFLLLPGMDSHTLWYYPECLL